MVSARKYILILLALLVGSCDQSPPSQTPPDEIQLERRTLGVCFMGDDPCQSIYVDLGEYEPTGRTKLGQEIPVYIFPSSVRNPNPLDSTGQYNPFRLQNNVFADHGRVWSMFEVRSKDLVLKAEPRPGLVLWGAGVTPPDTTDPDIPRPRTRDLYHNPFKGEEEILLLAERGEVEVVNLFFNTDCPLVDPLPNDVIVNLNPNFPICGQ